MRKFSLFFGLLLSSLVARDARAYSPYLIVTNSQHIGLTQSPLQVPETAVWTNYSGQWFLVSLGTGGLSPAAVNQLITSNATVSGWNAAVSQLARRSNAWDGAVLTLNASSGNWNAANGQTLTVPGRCQGCGQ